MKNSSNQIIKTIVFIVITATACGQLSVETTSPTNEGTITSTSDTLTSNTITPYIPITPRPAQTETPYFTITPKHNPTYTLTEIPYVTLTPMPTLTETPYPTITDGTKPTWTPRPTDTPTSTPYSHTDILQRRGEAIQILLPLDKPTIYIQNLEIAANSEVSFLLIPQENLEWGRITLNKIPLDRPSIWFSLYGIEDGTILAQETAVYIEWNKSGVPMDQEYLMIVTNPGEVMNYDLEIRTSRRILFEEGTSSTTVEGVLTGNSYNSYKVHAERGQTISVNVISGEDFAVVEVIGVIDFTYDCVGDDLVTSCAFTGSKTQDYEISVYSKTTMLGAELPSTPINYTLEVSVE